MDAAVEVSLRARVIELGERWAMTQTELINSVVELDDSGEWAVDGAASCAHWIAEVLDVELCTAREWLRIGRSLRALPAIGHAFDAGEVSYSKVRALTRVATPEHEQELLDLARGVAAGRLGHALARWQAARETPAETEARHHRSRAVRWRVDADGMTVLTIVAPPKVAGSITSAVDLQVVRRKDAAAEAAESSGQWPSLAQQRHDALWELFTDGGARAIAEVIFHVRGDGCTMDDGTPISANTVAALLDDAFVRLLIHDAEARPVNASSRRRHPTRRQQRVVHERDGGRCVDCGSGALLQYDHDPEYAQSRRTHTDELILRCAVCHQRRHECRADPLPTSPTSTAIRDIA